MDKESFEILRVELTDMIFKQENQIWDTIEMIIWNSIEYELWFVSNTNFLSNLLDIK